MKKSVTGELEGHGRIVRLIALTRILRNEPFLTRAQLAAKLRITERQFYIDRNALASAGFEFRWDRRQQRHIIEKDELREGVPLSYIESVALGCAIIALHRGGETNLAGIARGAVEKLLDAATTDSAQTLAVRELLTQIPVTPAQELLSGAPPAFVEAFAMSLAERRSLHISYENLRRERKDYQVHVYSLFVGGLDGLSLYADAWDADARAYKVFRLSRVRDYHLGEHFRPRTDYSFEARHRYVWQAWSVGGEPKQVRLHVCAGAEGLVLRERLEGRFKVVDRPDGSFDMTCLVTDIRELVWWSLLWAGQAYVLSPPEAVALARDAVRRLSEVYEFETQL